MKSNVFAGSMSSLAITIASAVFAFGLFGAAPTARSQCTAPPTVTFNPSDETAFPGQQVSFFAEGSSSAGCPVTYAWYERISGVPTYISGATSQTLTVTTPSYPGDPNRNLFGCKIQNSSGSVFIDEVRLTILDPDCTSAPAVTQQPQDQTAEAGKPVTFTVVASSPPGCQLRYQWFERVGVDGDADPIPGATNTSVTIIATHHLNDPDRNKFGCDIRSDGGVTDTRDAVLTVVAGLMEAEELNNENSSGDTVRLVLDTAAHGGVTKMVDSNATGDFLTLRIPNIPAGTYSVRVGYKKHPSRGKVQASIGKIGGSLGDIGPVIDLYSSSPGYQEYTLGNWTPTSTSDKQIRFRVTGKNSNSSGYTMNIDYVKLVKQ
jgi:hypothetical protein